MYLDKWDLIIIAGVLIYLFYKIYKEVESLKDRVSDLEDKTSNLEDDGEEMSDDDKELEVLKWVAKDDEDGKK